MQLGFVTAILPELSLREVMETAAEIGYVVIDVETERAEEALTKLKNIEGTIRARILH